VMIVKNINTIPVITFKNVGLLITQVKIYR